MFNLGIIDVSPVLRGGYYVTFSCLCAAYHRSQFSPVFVSTWRCATHRHLLLGGYSSSAK